MKAFLLGILFLLCVGAAGYIGLKYFTKAPVQTGAVKFTTPPITKIGELRKTNVTASDFTHVLISPGQSIGVASFHLRLDNYIGKKVEVTGQYSGDTLYADTIKEIPYIP